MNGTVQRHIDDVVEEIFPKVLNKISHYQNKTADLLEKTYTRWKSIDPEIRKLIVSLGIVGIGVLYATGVFSCENETQTIYNTVAQQTTSYNNF